MDALKSTVRCRMGGWRKCITVRSVRLHVLRFS